ncbi:MAG: 30S ribosomal protein S8 [Thermodesulfobacteriota bacterium]|nr:30S ribosomal protein S8 [Thermodesulfobacteriota bacterium]
MTMTDPIADMLTRIRNAGKARHHRVEIPGSKLKVEIAKILKQQGYIKNYKFIKDNKQGILRVYLKYDKTQQHVIYGIERVSKAGRRVYAKNKDVVPVLNGMGIAILSTSKGVMTDKQAMQEKVGGEVLCNVW